MRFSDFTSVSEMTKESQVEVLLSYISVDANGVPKVLPVRCPGAGRQDNVLMGPGGEPSCASGGGVCPYLVGAEFEFDSSTKKILCEAMS